MAHNEKIKAKKEVVGFRCPTCSLRFEKRLSPQRSVPRQIVILCPNGHWWKQSW